jgi:hypothetical protein
LKLRLESRRGRRAGAGTCSNCGRFELSLWKYSKSTIGPVALCATCKDLALDRSFGKIDALKMSDSA